MCFLKFDGTGAAPFQKTQCPCDTNKPKAWSRHGCAHPNIRSFCGRRGSNPCRRGPDSVAESLTDSPPGGLWTASPLTIVLACLSLQKGLAGKGCPGCPAKGSAIMVFGRPGWIGGSVMRTCLCRRGLDRQLPVAGGVLPCLAPSGRSEPGKLLPAGLLAADIPAPSGAGLSCVLHKASICRQDMAQEVGLGCALPADDTHADRTAVCVCLAGGPGLPLCAAHPQRVSSHHPWTPSRSA